MFLSTLRGGGTLLDQILECGQNQQGLSDDFYHILSGVLQALDSEIQWPSPAERLALKGSLWDFPVDGLFCPIFLVDGTIQKVLSPHDASEPLLYVSRKKCHGFNHQLVCQWNGKIVAVFPGFNGKVHDSACYQSTELFTQKAHFFDGNETLIGDSGYVGCDIMHIRRNAIERVDLEFNRKLRRHRVVIEFVFGALKKKFDILQKPWSRGRNRHLAGDTFFVCCLLFNFWMSKYGYLRGLAYQHQHKLELWESKLLELAGHDVAWGADDEVFEMIFEGRADDLYRMLENNGVL
jgi:hypothetical protein